MRVSLPITVPANGQWNGGKRIPAFKFFRVHHRSKTNTAGIAIETNDIATGGLDHDYEFCDPGQRLVRNVGGPADPFVKTISLLNLDASNDAKVMLEVSDTPIVDLSEIVEGPAGSVVTGASIAAGQTVPSDLAAVESFDVRYNGTSWDPVYNNADLTLLTSAVRTSTTNSPLQTNTNAAGVILFLVVTAASGTGGLQVQIVGQDPGGSGDLFFLSVAPTAVTTVGWFAYELSPGASTAAPGSGSGSLVQRTAGALPRDWKARVTHGDASSYTYQLSASYAGSR